jgi:crossover junction endodeoxyribonuclease RuvC
MYIAGIDPGTATTGYGVLDLQKDKLTVIDYGIIATRASSPLSQRLEIIYDQVSKIFSTYLPIQVAIEQLFFNTNTTTALSVGQARGIILLAAQQLKAEVFEYTPLQVKQAVVGYGRARKEQIQHMVKTILRMSKSPKPDDAADALAVAICHHQHNRLASRIKESESS